MIWKLISTRALRTGIVPDAQSHTLVLHQRVNKLGQACVVVTGQVESAEIVVAGHQLRGSPLPRIVIETPYFGRVALSSPPSSDLHGRRDRPREPSVADRPEDIAGMFSVGIVERHQNVG